MTHALEYHVARLDGSKFGLMIWFAKAHGNCDWSIWEPLTTLVSFLASCRDCSMLAFSLESAGERSPLALRICRPRLKASSPSANLR